MGAGGHLRPPPRVDRLLDADGLALNLEGLPPLRNEERLVFAMGTDPQDLMRLAARRACRAESGATAAPGAAASNEAERRLIAPGRWAQRRSELDRLKRCLGIGLILRAGAGPAWIASRQTRAGLGWALGLIPGGIMSPATE